MTLDIKIDISGTNNSLNMLKLCLLYFDKITVDMPGAPIKNVYKHYKKAELYPYINENIVNQLSYLEELNCINIEITDIDYMFYTKDNLLLHIGKPLASIIYEILETVNITEITERNEILNNLPSEFRNDGCTYVALLRYYLFNVYYNLIDNKITISDLETINNVIFKLYDKSLNQLIKNNIKINCASILLPDLSNATFDDILEIKYNASAELAELREYIELLNKNFDVEKTDYFDEIIKQKINPSIRNLEYKIKDVKIGVAQKFITEIKNPLSYAPLIGTVFNNVPAHISFLISLGLISANVGLEYIKQLNNIKKDNMYFLFKLRKML